MALARARLTDDLRRKSALLSEALDYLSTGRTVLGPKHDGFARAQLDVRDAEIRAELGDNLAGSTDRVACALLLAEADSALTRAGAALTVERYPLQHAEVILVQGLVADVKWRRLGEADDRRASLAALRLALEQIPETSDPHMHRRLQRVLDRLSESAPGGSRR